jgi:hypothetical protein
MSRYGIQENRREHWYRPVDDICQRIFSHLAKQAHQKDPKINCIAAKKQLQKGENVGTYVRWKWLHQNWHEESNVELIQEDLEKQICKSTSTGVEGRGKGEPGTRTANKHQTKWKCKIIRPLLIPQHSSAYMNRNI